MFETPPPQPAFPGPLNNPLPNTHRDAVFGLQNLFTFTHGWLEDDTPPPSRGSIFFARSFLAQLHAKSMTPPYVYPTQEGGVNFEWGNGELSTSMEFFDNGTSAHLHVTNTTTMRFETFNMVDEPQSITDALQWLQRVIP